MGQLAVFGDNWPYLVATLAVFSVQFVAQLCPVCGPIVSSCPVSNVFSVDFD